MTAIDAALKNLRFLQEEHSKLALETLQAEGGALYPMDLLVAAVLNRSVCLLDGFCGLIEKRNFVAAAPLLRMQLDNPLRLQAAWLVDKPHELATEVLAGTAIRIMRDRRGKKMTDQYLLSRIASEYPHLERVYEHLSGYVHLSYKHFFNMMKLEKGHERKFQLKISAVDSHVQEETYLEALHGFAEITGILFRYVEGWRVAKDGKARAK